MDNFDIGSWFGLFANVNHVRVVEAADDVNNGVRVADSAQELVAQPFATAGALYQTGDIREFNRRRNRLRNLQQRGQALQSLVGHRDHRLVRFDGAKGVVSHGCTLGTGESVESGAFANVGQADDSNVK